MSEVLGSTPGCGDTEYNMGPVRQALTVYLGWRPLGSSELNVALSPPLTAPVLLSSLNSPSQFSYCHAEEQWPSFLEYIPEHITLYGRRGRCD